jgi:hypothetical protein
MEKLSTSSPATPESVWAALQDLTEKFAETNRLFEESRIDLVQSMKESRIDFDQSMKESRIAFDQSMEESRIAFDQRMDKSRADSDREMKELKKLMGGWAYNHGSFAEEYFFNSFENGKQNFFGEKFDKINKNVTGLRIEDEYDILLINGETICIVEVKYKAHENDVPGVLKKAETFRINYPDYENHRIYLGLATMAFYPKLEQVCINEGIAIVKQVGNNVVINDEHLKVY